MGDCGPGATVGLEVEYLLEERDGHFAAATRQFGLVVYAPTAEGIERRIDEAVAFYMDGFADLDEAREYLERHRIGHSVHYPPAGGDAPGQGHALRRVTVPAPGTRPER